MATLSAQLPDIGTPLSGDRRTFPLLDFPYSVNYRRDESGLRVLLVRHQSLNLVVAVNDHIGPTHYAVYGPARLRFVRMVRY